MSICGMAGLLSICSAEPLVAIRHGSADGDQMGAMKWAAHG